MVVGKERRGGNDRRFAPEVNKGGLLLAELVGLVALDVAMVGVESVPTLEIENC